jgi:hypothetical protein
VWANLFPKRSFPNQERHEIWRIPFDENQKLKKYNTIIRDPKTIFVSNNLRFAIVGGDGGAYHIQLENSNSSNKHAIFIDEPVSFTPGKKWNDLLVLSDDIGSVYRISNIQQWKNANKTSIIASKLLKLSGNGQGAYDHISDALYATNRNCNNKQGCILKISNISTTPNITKFAWGSYINDPVGLALTRRTGVFQLLVMVARSADGPLLGTGDISTAAFEPLPHFIFFTLSSQH